MPNLLDEALAGLARGWSFTPLDGKKPYLDAWDSRAQPGEAEIREWSARGNLGLRTGPAPGSGLIVLDIDSEALDAGVKLDDYPTTVTAITGGGGYHLYFKAPPWPMGNSHAKLGLPKGVHVRGEGGQVVFPGSIHPETKEPYLWFPDREPVAVPAVAWRADLIPADPERRRVMVWMGWQAGTSVSVLAGELGMTWKEVHAAAVSWGLAKRLPPPPAPAPTPEPTPENPAWTRAAAAGEFEAVANAQEGGRNDALNTAAFNLGQIVGGGSLAESEATTMLLEAATTAGLPEQEARSTIRSGLEAGRLKPRYAPPPRTAAPPSPASGPPVQPSQPTTDPVLVPGLHVDASKKVHTIGTIQFAREVLLRLPLTTLYRQDGIVGTVSGPPGSRVFREADGTAFRLIIDGHMELAQWKGTTNDAGEAIRFRCFTHARADHGELVRSAATEDKTVAELKLMVSYPIFTPAWELAPPGWHADTGILYDEPPAFAGLAPEKDPVTIRAVLDELLIDFPFKTESDRQNFIGLLLTPIVRPAIEGNTPMHLLLAPQAGAGKTKIINELMGIIFTGEVMDAGPLPDREDEIEKRITSLLLRGNTLLHFDNIADVIDSPSMASLLTASKWAGRELGKSRTLTLPNYSTVMGSGNNVHISGEMGRRIIPISLQPTTAHPEQRTDFHHEVKPYCYAHRRRIMECLVGAVLVWRAGGAAPSGKKLGSFSEWAEAVGGILAAIGYTEWRTTDGDWRMAANPEDEELAELIAAWSDEYQIGMVSAAVVMDLAKQHDILSRLFTRPSEKSAQVAFGKYLSKLENRVVDVWRVKRRGGGSERRYWLERVAGVDDRTAPGKIESGDG